MDVRMNTYGINKYVFEEIRASSLAKMTKHLLSYFRDGNDNEKKKKKV